MFHSFLQIYKEGQEKVSNSNIWTNNHVKLIILFYVIL